MLRWASHHSNKFTNYLSRGFRNKSDIYGGVNPLNFSETSPKVLPEFSHITSVPEREWLEQEFSKSMSTPLPPAQQLNSLRMVQMAESFEHFLHKKFSNYKRYSGEGLESLVPCLYSISSESHLNLSQSIIFSIAHRGKLSVLVSLLNYPLRNLFYKIRGNSLMPEEWNKENYYYLDDIATHIAITAERPELKGLRLSMLHNPSHLEIGGAVGMGKTRSKIDKGTNSMHVWVHGDAALAGQGVCYEVTQMAHLPHYSVNGTVHVVANNQLGFTANEETGRSSPYCTDVFKIIEAPVVHVNALSVDNVVKMAKLAVKYRNKFKNDFAIDLIGYRRYGHNEVDDPTFTNPVMYKKIKKMKGVAFEYSQELLNQGIVTQQYLDKLKTGLDDHLNKEFALGFKEHLEKDLNGLIKYDSFQSQWQGFSPIHQGLTNPTGYSLSSLEKILKKSVEIPSHISAHPILLKNFSSRLENFAKNKIDWATAESLAIGSLLEEGFTVRLTGEDVMRGTFTQRHIGVYCQETENLEVPLQKIGPGKLIAANSLLSELGVVGFEYGYSLDDPTNLVIWEAQFGDFSNMAQPIIDTYIVSGEAKWARQSGIVLLLPHGQEAQGPDHSSALLERTLGQVNDPLSNQINVQVANCVFPANYFHLLRSLVKRNFRRPLILGTPKSGLRNKFAVSPQEDFDENSKFKPVILKNMGNGSKNLFVCNGKVFLDLVANFNDISVLLIEELVPLPYKEIKEIINNQGKNIVWVQEEPLNLGVYSYIRPWLEKIAGNLNVIARPGIAANSPGNSKDFKEQQDQIFKQVGELI